MENESIQSPYSDIYLPPGLEEKTVRQLIQNNLLEKRNRYRLDFMIAASILLVAAGVWLGTMMRPHQPVARDELKPFMLLLYTPPEFIQGEQHAAEYGAWLKNLGTETIKVEGDELSDRGWIIGNKEGKLKTEQYLPTGSNGPVAGYFIIRVPSEEKALMIAAGCPHLKYNGIVELRPLQVHGNNN